MFQALRQSSPFYILEKGGEKPTLRIGQVISASEPKDKFGNYPTAGMPSLNAIVDVSVQVGEEKITFEKLPANAEIANFGTNGVVVSDSREAMTAEVSNMLRNSKQIVESVDYHQQVIQSCEEMLTRINPQIAKEKQQEQDICNLKSDVSGMKGDISDMKDMLTDVLERIRNK